MAEFLVSKLGERLIDSLIQESSHVRDEIEVLRAELKVMASFLKEADAYARNGDEKVRDWISAIVDAVLDTNDIIDEFLFSERRSECLLIKFECFSKVLQPCRFRSMLKGSSSKISDFTVAFRKYGIRQLSGRNEVDFSKKRLIESGQTNHPVDCDVVGFEDDIKELVARLTVEGNSNQIIVIHGMTGLGKTTLAAEVFKAGEVRRKFDCLVWVSASQQFQVSDIWKTILFELDNVSLGLREKIAKMRSDEIALELCQALRGRKYFVVLDDVSDGVAWDSLKTAFPFEYRGRGSKILLTTRSNDASLLADNNYFLHHLRCLDKIQSWKLFLKKARFFEIDMTNVKDRTEMKQLGEKMLEHCAGFPLAIVLLGGLLSTRLTVDEWETLHLKIKTCLRKCKMHDREGSIQSDFSWLLDLCYQDLPYYLKPCFLYLGIFPIGFKIRVNELCKIWIAEGLISLSQQQKGFPTETMEDAAYGNILELVQRCMIQVDKWSSIGRIKICRVHDLVRDICLFKSTKENFPRSIDFQDQHGLVDVFPCNSARSGSLTFYMDYGNDFLALSNENRHFSLESLLCFYPPLPPTSKVLRSSLRKFCKLRVLKLANHERIGSMPKEIGSLFHLRYLSLKDCQFKRLPSSIRKLRFLETLDLRTSSILELPNVIWNLKKLRHLYLPRSYKVSGKKLRLDNLSYLQTLKNLSMESCDLNHLARLTNLRKLKVYVDKDMEYILVSMRIVFSNLQSLMVENLFGPAIDITQISLRCRETQILQVKSPIIKLPGEAQLSANLLKLTLTRTFLRDDPMATLQRLPNLRVLLLEHNAFVGFEMVNLRGGFPLLESLFLVELFCVEEWWVEKGALSNLCRLQIESCHKLETLPDGLRHITTLKEIVIQRMPMKFKMRVEEGGQDFNKVQHVPSLVFLKILGMCPRACENAATQK